MLSDRLFVCGSFRDLVFFKNSKIFKVVKRAHTGWINGVLLVPGNISRIISGGGKSVKVWDLEDFKCLDKFIGHKSTINCLSACDDTEKGDFLFATGTDFPEPEIRIFSYKTFSVKTTIKNTRSVRKIKSFRNGRDLLVLEGSLSNMKVKLVNYQTHKMFYVHTAGVIKSIEILSKKAFVVANEEGLINFFSILDYRTPLNTFDNKRIVGGLCTHIRNGKFLSINVYNSTISFFHPKSGTEESNSRLSTAFSQGFNDMLFIDYAPEEDVVITSTKDSVVRVWKLLKNRTTLDQDCLEFEKTNGFVKCAALISRNDSSVLLPRVDFISQIINEEMEEEETEGEEENEPKKREIVKYNSHIMFPRYLLFDNIDLMDLSKERVSELSGIFFEEDEDEDNFGSPELLFLKVVFGMEPKRLGLSNIVKLMKCFYFLQQTNLIRACLRYLYDRKNRQFDEFLVNLSEDKDDDETKLFFKNALAFFKVSFFDEHEELYNLLISCSEEKPHLLPTFSQVYRLRLGELYLHFTNNDELQHNLVLEIGETEQKISIPVHQEVLIRGSSFFHQLFKFQTSTNQLLDEKVGKSNVMKKVRVELLGEEEVRKLIEFCYTGSFKDEQNDEKTSQALLSLLVHSEMYMDTPLKTFTLRKLKSIFQLWREKKVNHEVVKKRIKEMYKSLESLPRGIQSELMHCWMDLFDISKKQMDILIGKVVVQRKKLKRNTDEKCMFCVKKDEDDKK